MRGVRASEAIWIGIVICLSCSLRSYDLPPEETEEPRRFWKPRHLWLGRKMAVSRCLAALPFALAKPCNTKRQRRSSQSVLRRSVEITAEKGLIEDLYSDDIKPGWRDRDLVKLQGRMLRKKQAADTKRLGRL